MTSAEVYNRYNTRKIKDFVQLIEVMKQMLKTIQSVSESFSSEILHALFTVSPVPSPTTTTTATATATTTTTTTTTTSSPDTQKTLEFPDMTNVLDFFDHSFNHEVAIEQGIIMPKPGMDPELDTISLDLQNTQQNLQNYLQQTRNRFNCQ